MRVSRISYINVDRATKKRPRYVTVRGSGFEVRGSGFEVRGSGFGVRGSRFGVPGSLLEWGVLIEFSGPVVVARDLVLKSFIVYLPAPAGRSETRPVLGGRCSS
jgi:hypothetical protein